MAAGRGIFRPVRPSASRPAIAWATVPLLGVVVAFGAGIVLAATLDYRYANYFLGATLLATVLGMAFYLRPRLASCMLLVGFVGLGAWYADVRHPLNDERHFGRHHREGDRLLATVTSLKQKDRSSTVELTVTGLLRDTCQLAVDGKLVAYLRGDTVRMGDRLLLASPVDTVPPPLNPRAFDYAGYLAGKNIFHRSFVDSTEWRRLGGPTGFSLRSYADHARETWFASLQPYLAGDDLAVAAALIMGKRDLLGAEVKSAYADTGAIHVLAVSGLHVGILALLVVQLLTLLLPARPGWLWVRTGCTLAAVWFFALLTGLSPSVQRAALMVTVVLLGKQLNRNNSVFNLLAIAALVMLVAEPKQLFQLGFQLSFAAVAGIALFARRLQRLVYLPGKLQLLWDAVAVSTAAQLGTLPLSLYYFGHFPVYFMLSGTLVIVFAYLVLGLGLLHGLLALIGADLLTGTLLNGVVGLQNAFIYFCRQLPGATAQLTDFGPVSAIGLTCLIASLAYLAFRPSHRGRWVAMGLAAALTVYWSLGPLLSPTPPQYTVYHLPRASLIDVYDGRGGTTIGDTIDQDDLDFNVTPWRRTFGLDFGPPLPFTADTVLNTVALHPPLLRLLDHTVLVLDGETHFSPAAPPAFVDMVLVRNGYRVDQLNNPLPDVPVIIDGSNPHYRTREWQTAYPSAWVTAEKGAYTLTP